ncbi:hypothetical protein CH063_15406 [Colletotrichum higginsianum]|uniref:Phenol hydroxylase-like C-terminal dimerisation domain-containing protein n=2 Tax=Colletotrichum higginsianum TaxID=80884 RepID=H1W2N8_COLHI|nr:hypothetical protein CH063_15406 [Colletotrichum higginsianum]
MRFNSFKVLNQACARPWHFQERLKADGRFRVVLFAGNVLDASQKARVDRFCAALDAPDSFLHRATPPKAPIDSVIEVLTVHSAKRTDTELLRDFPDILHPFDPHTGWDYNKVFVDDESYHEGHGEAYRNYGIDRQRGCAVVVRPDQYVAWIGELEDFDGLQKYFEGCLVLGHRVANGSSVPPVLVNLAASASAVGVDLHTNNDCNGINSDIYYGIDGSSSPYLSGVFHCSALGFHIAYKTKSTPSLVL